MEASSERTSDEGKVIRMKRGEAEYGSRAWAEALRRESKELADHMETGYMQLAKRLYLLFDVGKDNDPKNPPWIVEWGHKTIGEFGEKELGMQRRKAERLRRIWLRFEVELAGMDPSLKERLIRLGWSKARELARPEVMSIRNSEEWVKRAEESSYPELCEAIAAYLVQKQAALQQAQEKGEDPASVSPAIPAKEDFEWKHFMLYDEQAKNVTAALERASQLSKSEKKGHNLDLICTDFLATNNFTSGDDDQRQAMFAKFEQLYGVRIVAIEQTTSKVVYGYDSLEKLARSGEETED